MRAAAVLNDVNWCAFALALVSPKYTVERALDYICGEETKHNSPFYLNETDTLDMIELRKQGVPYYEIGAMYGIDQASVWRRIKKYERRHNGTQNPRRQ